MELSIEIVIKLFADNNRLFFINQQYCKTLHRVFIPNHGYNFKQNYLLST